MEVNQLELSPVPKQNNILKKVVTKSLQNKQLLIQAGSYSYYNWSKVFQHITKIEAQQMSLKRNYNSSLINHIIHIDLSNLSTLNLGQNNINNIESLASLNCPSLHTLLLNDNRISSLRTLRKLVFPLKRLAICGNYISELTFIECIHFQDKIKSLELEEQNIILQRYRDRVVACQILANLIKLQAKQIQNLCICDYIQTQRKVWALCQNKKTEIKFKIVHNTVGHLTHEEFFSPVDLQYPIHNLQVMNKVIHDYILLQKIGSGQYGNVYRANHKTVPGQFAVKVMKAQKFKQTPKLSEFTQNEIGVLSKMKHPNIIKFVEMLKTTSNYYLVYQFCNGGTLSELIKKQGKLSEEDALNIFDQLRHAFKALHQAHILHRDIKPTNILFHDGKIKLADFGFCKQLMKENDMAQTMVGSPIYMAPEVLKGLVYDSRADIWSLGVILYEMLYGICPYEQNSIPKLINVIDNFTVNFPEDVNVSMGTKAFIKQMLTLKFKERIPPDQLIKYDIKIEVQVPKQSKLAFRQTGKYLRRALIYLTQSLEAITELTEEPIYLRLTFLIYKIIASFQRNIVKDSPYWKILQMEVLHKDWTDILSQESAIMKPFGDIIREALMREDTSLKTKVELETDFIDSKYFLESMRRIENNQTRMRLINCFLYNRHLCMVLEKRGVEWEDPVQSILSLREKEEICYKQAKYY